MDFDKYNLSLRQQVYPDKNLSKNVKRIISEAVSSGYTDICLVVNNGAGHPTKEQLSPQVEAARFAAEEIRKSGLTVSLNPLITMGQGNMRDLVNGRKFRPITGANGEKESAACPLDVDFIDYIKDIYAYLTREILPDLVWLEDDFRMHNRFGVGWGGCFCEEHLKEYSKYLGFTVTRESFLEGLLKEGEGRSPYREAYAFVTRRAMEDLAANIAVGAKQGYDKVRIGFMTSHPEEHAIEYRDWARLFAAADDKNAPVDRIHLPCYEECAPQVYGWLFNKICVQTRARIPENTVVLPEMETAPRSLFSKSATFAAMTAETTSALAADGITMYIYGGTGVIKDWNYGAAIKKIIPFMQAIKREKLKFSSLDGVIVPFSDESVLNVKPTNYCTYLDHIKPDDSYFSGYLPAIGVSYKFARDPIGVKGEVVAVSGQWLRNYAVEAVRKFLKNNRVILNAEAILTLVDMGLSEEIGVKSAKWAQSGAGKACIEKADRRFLVYGLNGYFDYFIPHLEIEYSDGDIVPYSRFYSYEGKFVHYGSVRRGNILLFPFEGERFAPQKLHPLREAVIKDFISGGAVADGKFIKSSVSLQGHNPSFIINAAMCCPYYFADSRVLIVNNFSLDEQKCAFYLPSGFTFNAVRILSRNGEWLPARFTRKGDKVTLTGKIFAPLKSTAIKFD